MNKENATNINENLSIPDIKNNKYTIEETELLKKWSNIAKNYSLLHHRAFLEYQNKNYSMAIPIIIMSTLSGTASFSINHFPLEYQRYVPLAIGGINIFVGILQTMIQFFKINEFINDHKKASIEFEKYSRNIIAELILPEHERTYSGTEFIHICKKEIDRIIEQSPSVPLHILNNLDNIIKNDFISNNSIKNIVDESYYDKIKENIQNTNKDSYSSLFYQINLKKKLFSDKKNDYNENENKNENENENENENVDLESCIV
jgi:hypothetical protein